ncbi:universal stress protein [Glaciibacter sp. 2TAF33]|uniref:universal stress protein n=1 Tax=Glaciibacter sp. 2TAF33 TaxID=3233015 RepID=UPI003F903981
MTDTRNPQAPILVGIDGSAASVEALHRAAELALGLDRPLEGIAVWELPHAMYDVYYPEPGWSPAGDAQQVLDAAAAAVFDGQTPDWYTASTRKGKPARVLIEASAGAEMLVLGSRGHGGFVGLMLGSVSMACAAHAQCPVLIVHPSKEASHADARAADAHSAAGGSGAPGS